MIMVLIITAIVDKIEVYILIIPDCMLNCWLLRSLCSSKLVKMHKKQLRFSQPNYVGN